MRVSLFKLRATLLIFTVLFTGTSAHSFAGLLPFIDNFEDGSATDGSPGTWLPGGSAEAVREVVGGDYILSHTALASSFVEGSTTGDVSIRTQLRILETDSFVFAAVFARSPSFASYFGGIRETGEIAIGESFAGGGITTRERVFTELNPFTTDVLLQFDVIGDQISLTAWATTEHSSVDISRQHYKRRFVWRFLEYEYTIQSCLSLF
jgi:hypothetical protein